MVVEFGGFLFGDCARKNMPFFLFPKIAFVGILGFVLRLWQRTYISILIREENRDGYVLLFLLLGANGREYMIWFLLCLTDLIDAYNVYISLYICRICLAPAAENM